MKNFPHFLPMLALAGSLALTGCDKTKDDVRPAKITSALTLNNDQYATLAGTSVTIDVLANDSVGQGAALSFGNPQHGSVAQIPGTTQYSYRPDSSFTGVDVFAYSVCLNGTCDSATVTITVGEITNCQPIANADYLTIGSGELFVIDARVNDVIPCGLIGNVDIQVMPTHGTAGIDAAAPNLIAYASDSGYVGPDQITYQLCAGNNCVTGVININVTAPTCSWNAVDDQVSVPVNGQITFSPLNNDTSCPIPFTDPVTLTVTQAPSHGTPIVNTSNHTITYEPNANYQGSDAMTYEVCVNGSCQTATINITVNGNCGVVPPQTFADTAFVAMGTVTDIDVLANDIICPGPGTISLNSPALQQPSHGSVSVVTVGGVQKIRYVPQSAGPVFDDFQYHVSFNNGSGIQTLTGMVMIKIL